MRTTLLTGGAGFIGSHVALALIRIGRKVAVLDNFVNSRPEVVDRLKTLTDAEIPVFEGDLRDSAFLDRVFADIDCDSVVHMAGLKAVGESVARPLHYYDNNVVGSLRLVETMLRNGVPNLVFSSSATVYGNALAFPITETAPIQPTNPYGASKAKVERILTDAQAAHPELRVLNLRYFNPVGADPSGRIGEDPRDTPNNLFPIIAQVAVGEREKLHVFGDDYSTPDGTGVRDYIHVSDLADAHAAGVEYLSAGEVDTALTLNLGTGQGYSVLQVINAWREASGQDIPYEVVDRRPGDVALSLADPTAATALLNWRARKTLDEMCEDHWRWALQSRNLSGPTQRPRFDHGNI